MATDKSDPTEQNTEPDIATLERKRSYNLTSRDDPSNPESTPSTPRKRTKRVGKLGFQDVRDFVPAGTSFSTNAVLGDEPQDIGDDSSQEEVDCENEILSGHELSDASGSASTEHHKALVEGRRLLVIDISPDATEEDLNDHHGNRGVDSIEEIEKETSKTSGSPQSVPPQDVRAASPGNWNAISDTKIRTVFGGSVGKAADSINEPRAMDGSHKNIRERSTQDIGLSALFLVLIAFALCKYTDLDLM